MMEIPKFEKISDPIQWLNIYGVNMKGYSASGSIKLDRVSCYFETAAVLEWFVNRKLESWSNLRKNSSLSFQKRRSPLVPPSQSYYSSRKEKRNPSWITWTVSIVIVHSINELLKVKKNGSNWMR